MTVDRILRHIKAQIQKAEWAIDRGEPYYDNLAIQETLEELEHWIIKRQVEGMRY